jgi:hypothetical protein
MGRARVLVYLDRGQAFSNALLAHVMAHEITHVLEGIDRHSSEGVMKAVCPNATTNT